MKEISDKIKDAVKNSKETSDDIAMYCDMSKATLYKIINGKNYTISSLNRVCAYFGFKIIIK